MANKIITLDRLSEYNNKIQTQLSGKAASSHTHGNYATTTALTSLETNVSNSLKQKISAIYVHHISIEWNGCCDYADFHFYSTSSTSITNLSALYTILNNTSRRETLTGVVYFEDSTFSSDLYGSSFPCGLSISSSSITFILPDGSYASISNSEINSFQDTVKSI